VLLCVLFVDNVRWAIESVWQPTYIYAPTVGSDPRVEILVEDKVVAVGEVVTTDEL
jgi:hypothetical protein